MKTFSHVILLALLALTQGRTIDESLPLKDKMIKNYEIKPRDYATIGGREYFIYRDTFVTANEAAVQCDRLGMSLVSLETREEEQLIHQYFDNNGLNQLIFWSSGRKENEVWFWSGSGANFTYTNWGVGRPYDYLPELCVFFGRYVTWSDYECDATTTLFMCEQND